MILNGKNDESPLTLGDSCIQTQTKTVLERMESALQAFPFCLEEASNFSPKPLVLLE
jgi:3'-phosphoadenosine 5'-phosphosulfate (PAPS) 3'-phosphatase